jgi:uncharacterized membrane protein
MHPKHFLGRIDEPRVVAAIRAAEQSSSGEIRVFVSEKQVDGVVDEAKVHFLRLGMEKTRARNGVLIYIAPRSRNFAIVGDVGVHERCGDRFWQEIASGMESHLKKERYTEALILAIERVGAVLAAHFPHQPDDRNELPDDIATDSDSPPHA